MKTRGRNPNPTAQAQSKHCFPLSTKTRHLIENVSLLVSILGAFLTPFPQKWIEGSRATPHSAHKTPTWTPRVPKWSQGCRHEVPRFPPKCPKDSQLYPICVKMDAQVSQWSPKATQSAKETPQGPAKCDKDTHRCQPQAQLDTNALGKAPGCKKTCTNRPRPGARRRRRRSGRGSRDDPPGCM